MIIEMKMLFISRINQRKIISALNCRQINTLADEAVVYIHWPFCKKICTYCNFNKYLEQNVDQERMTKCLVAETSTLIHHSGVERVNSIFFGGGTPSLASAKTISEVIDTVRKHAKVPIDAEISLEGSPESLSETYLKEISSAGVNRMSIGVQTFSDKDLKSLNRSHNVEDALRSVRTANEIFPDRVSLDLLFARPRQTISQWISELEMVKALKVNHVSTYQLTLERGTPLFKAVKSKTVVVPNEDVIAEMYELAVSHLQSSGYRRYEISNFAQKGAECKHNQAYWKGTQYIGVGPGSHGRFVPRNLGLKSREARVQVPDPKRWMETVEKFGHATAKRTEQSTVEILEEILATGLRMTDGISDEHWKLFSGGLSLEDTFSDCVAFHNFRDQGWIRHDSTLRATEKGLQVLDNLLPSLIAHLQHVRKNGTYR